MKKIVLVLALAAVIATGTAFADHPKGFGIGVVGNYSSWGFGGTSGGLSLKLPSIPIYWAFNFGIDPDGFGLGITGDSYIVDKNISGPLHYFIGIGGYFTFYSYSQKYSGYLYSYDYSYTWMYGGVRFPIGLSIQPVPLFEIFFDIAPSVGIGIYSGYDYKYKIGTQEYKFSNPGTVGLGWGAPLEVGIRLWF
jgi:hypothetical protein